VTSDDQSRCVESVPRVDTSAFSTFTFTSYSWQTGGFVLSATGSQTISTTVDQSTDLSQTPLSGTTSGGTFTPNAKYTSVDAAYHAVTTLLAGNALNAAQKAAISITNVVHATAGDASTPVIAYTVSLHGAYSPTNMRLGDLQRSVMRMLNTAIQSEPFQQLAAEQGVTGIQARPYSSQFSDLTQS
jgi:hypothetical protein